MTNDIEKIEVEASNKTLRVSFLGKRTVGMILLLVAMITFWVLFKWEDWYTILTMAAVFHAGSH